MTRSYVPIIGLQRTSACGLAAELNSLTVAILAALAFPACRSAGNWQFRPGALIAVGEEVMALRNTPGWVVTLNGSRRVSQTELEEVALWHALVLLPSETNGSGGDVTTTGPVETDTLTWTFPDGTERKLPVQFNGLTRMLRVGGKGFSTDRGNLFVIRLDHAWKPMTVQLPETVRERLSPRATLDRIKAADRTDTEVQGMETYE